MTRRATIRRRRLLRWRCATVGPALQYELVGFDGNRTTTQAVDLDMIFLQKAFRGRYLLIDEERGILGRDVLAGVVVLLNGPAQEWSEYQIGPAP